MRFQLTRGRSTVKTRVLMPLDVIRTALGPTARRLSFTRREPWSAKAARGVPYPVATYVDLQAFDVGPSALPEPSRSPPGGVCRAMRSVSRQRPAV